MRRVKVAAKAQALQMADVARLALLAAGVLIALAAAGCSPGQPPRILANPDGNAGKQAGTLPIFTGQPVWEKPVPETPVRVRRG
jgi:hypothetical protein